MEDTNIQPQKSFLSSKEILKRARKFYKDNFKKLWPLYILGGLGGMSFGYRSSGGSSTSSSSSSSSLDFLSVVPWWAWILIGILFISIYIFLFISRISLLKGISDTRKGKFIGVKDSYRKGFAIFWSFVLIGIMISLSVIGAMTLLIIPGIILSVYLSFSGYELIDKQKKGFQALLGSWSLVRGHWRTVFGKIIMIGLRIFFTFIICCAAILIAAMLLFVPGMFFHVKVLIIAGILIGVLEFLSLIFAFIVPLSAIATFELYHNLCDIRESNKAVEEVLDKKRKRKITFCIVLGILAFIAISAAVVLVSVNQYVQKAKNGAGNYSTSYIVGEIKKGTVFPYKVDALTELTDIIAEPSAIRYTYIILGGDVSKVTNDSLKQLITPDACNTQWIKDLLEHNINFESLYTVEKTQQTFFVTLSKADCP